MSDVGHEVQVAKAIDIMDFLPTKAGYSWRKIQNLTEKFTNHPPP
jgi:hypothetical protein